jgi:acyl-CoA reductase-like NAD-dependent aldehyde dehydrogenase
VRWKPSEKTPLTALACQQIIGDVLRNNDVPEGVSCLITGGREAGEWLARDPRVALVSATGSTRMGKAVAEAVAGRLGRSLLELGGNNAIIVSEHAIWTCYSGHRVWRGRYGRAALHDHAPDYCAGEYLRRCESPP